MASSSGSGGMKYYCKMEQSYFCLSYTIEVSRGQITPVIHETPCSQKGRPLRYHERLFLILFVCLA